MSLRIMDKFLQFIVSSVLICGVAAADDDGPGVDGYGWWIGISVLLAVLIAVIIGAAFLYRRKFQKSLPCDQENQNKDENLHSTKPNSNSVSTSVLNSHANINEQNKSTTNYGATQEVQWEKCKPRFSSASSSREEKSAKTSSTMSLSSISSVDDDIGNVKHVTDKELEDEVDSFSDRENFEEESLFGSSYKSSRYRVVRSTSEEESNSDDPDYSEDLKNMSVTEISRASLKRKIEQYIAQADGSSINSPKQQEMDEDILHVDGSGRYILNKDILHLSDLGNHSITTTKKRESLNLSMPLKSNESIDENP